MIPLDSHEPIGRSGRRDWFTCATLTGGPAGSGKRQILAYPLTAPWLWLPGSSWIRTLFAVVSTLSRLWIAFGLSYPSASESNSTETLWTTSGLFGSSTILKRRPFG